MSAASRDASSRSTVDSWSAHLNGCRYSLNLKPTFLRHDERALFSASEFWAATLTNELSGHLGSVPMERLQEAGVAFLKIGANILSRSIFEAIAELHGASIGNRLDEYVVQMEDRLQMTLDPVDVLIAQFADHCALPAIRDRRAVLHLVSARADSASRNVLFGALSRNRQLLFFSAKRIAVLAGSVRAAQRTDFKVPPAAFNSNVPPTI